MLILKSSLGIIRWISNRACYSARGPDADRHDNPLIRLVLTGSCFGADSHLNTMIRH